MFLIDDEKDADTLNDSEDYTQKDNAKTVILSQLEKKLLENNININNFVKTLFKKRKNDLTEKEIESTLSRLTAAIDKYRKLTKQ